MIIIPYKEIKAINKNDLKEQLVSYKNILSNTIYDYLTSLIELEFSIINNYISDKDKSKLSELDIYKDIANYNIVERAILLTDKKSDDINLIYKGKEDEYQIYADINDNNIILFDYDYIGSEDSNYEFGCIHLYRTVNSIEQIEKEIKRISNLLDYLYNKENPFSQYDNKYGGPDSYWNFNHFNKIKQYEDKLTKLKEKTELTDKDIKEIEITNMVHQLLLEDYNLKEEDFNEKKSYNKDEEKTELYKSYIKKVPKIDIKNSIKYI